MKAKYRIIKNSLVYGVLSGLTATGMLYPSKFTPLRYPSSQKDDQKAIGADMWKAFGRVSNEKKKTAETA